MVRVVAGGGKGGRGRARAAAVVRWAASGRADTGCKHEAQGAFAK